MYDYKKISRTHIENTLRSAALKWVAEKLTSVTVNVSPEQIKSVSSAWFEEDVSILYHTEKILERGANQGRLDARVTFMLADFEELLVNAPDMLISFAIENLGPDSVPSPKFSIEQSNDYFEITDSNGNRPEVSIEGYDGTMALLGIKLANAENPTVAKLNVILKPEFIARMHELNVAE